VIIRVYTACMVLDVCGCGLELPELGKRQQGGAWAGGNGNLHFA